MRSLFKIYCRSFFQDATYLFFLIWPLGLTINYLNNSAESMQGIFIPLFSIFFIILFFFSYPLGEGLKWILYTPIAKFKIFSFNFIFQFYKFLVILFYFYLMKTILNNISPHQNFIELTHNELIILKTLNNELSKGIISEYLETPVLLGPFLILFLLFTIIFSVTPRAIIDNGSMTLMNLLRNRGHYWKKLKENKKIIYFIILFIVFLRLSQNFWTAPLMIVCLGFLYLCFTYNKTYCDKFIVSKKTRRKSNLVVVMTTLFIFLLGLIYSHFRLKQEGLSASSQITEISFLKGFHRRLEKNEIFDYFQKDITDDDIKSLLDIYQSRYSNNLEKIPTRFFQSIILSKKNLKGLEASLKLFDLKELSLKQIELYLDNWEKINENNRQKGPFLVQYQTLKEVIFNLHQSDFFSRFLNSKSNLKKFIAIKFYEDYLSETSTEEIIKIIDSFNTDLLAIGSKIISKKHCHEFSSIELIHRNQQKKFQLENFCKKN